jgi:hypothetical protein
MNSDRFDDGSIRIDGHKVVITLDHDGFEWLVNEIRNQNDLATKNMWWYLCELKKRLIQDDA